MGWLWPTGSCLWVAVDHPRYLRAPEHHMWSRSNICYFGHSNPLLIDWLIDWSWRRIVWGYKKLSCRREAARRFVSLNILLSHSSSLNVIRNDTVAYIGRVYKSLLVFQWYYVCMSYRFWDIQRQRMAWPWNWGIGVFHGHWKWRRSIDHIRLSIGPPL